MGQRDASSKARYHRRCIVPGVLSERAIAWPLRVKRIKSYCLIYSSGPQVFRLRPSSSHRSADFACIFYASSVGLAQLRAAPSFRSTPYSHYYPEYVASGRICSSRVPKFLPRPVNGVDRAVIERLQVAQTDFSRGKSKSSLGEPAPGIRGPR